MATPLARARGLGAGHGGTGHFIKQRATAIAHLALVPFVLYAGAALATGEARTFFASPVHQALSVLAAISIATHMRIGMQVIIEDYIHHETRRWALLALNAFAAYGAAVVAIVSLLALGR